ncbi:hypothetical protein ACET3Z_013756 [Daucus carota]
MAVVERELGQSGGRSSTTAIAFHFSCATVSGGTGKVVVVGVAVSTRPQATGPVGRGGGEGSVGEGGEKEASAFEEEVAGVGLDGGPERERAVVDDGENRGRSSRRESYEEAEEKERREGGHLLIVVWVFENSKGRV